jgi:hypothetical protein
MALVSFPTVFESLSVLGSKTDPGAFLDYWDFLQTIHEKIPPRRSVLKRPKNARNPKKKKKSKINQSHLDFGLGRPDTGVRAPIGARSRRKNPHILDFSGIIPYGISMIPDFWVRAPEPYY